MITVENDALVFTFPEVHKDAVLRVSFQRTLRIPDDDKEYPLPPGLGRFPLRHVDDFPKRVPRKWLKHGGVIMPMYQAEAMWLNFDAYYPFAIKVAAGMVNALTGSSWDNRLHDDPQDYLVVPEQPWLDGFCVKKGVIRQFVAMPLGSGYTAEEQITGKADYGGLQLIAYPMKARSYEKLVKVLAESRPQIVACEPAAPAMGLAPGGKMRQHIYSDPHKLSDWNRRRYSRCYVHIVNSLVWHHITGELPPYPPPTAKEYTAAGLPWFDYYDELEAIKGAQKLAKLKSVAKMGKKKGDVPLPENEPVSPDFIVKLRRRLGGRRVREW